MSPPGRKDRTIATHAGNHPFDHQGVVNPPIYRASTILFERMEDIEKLYKQRFDFNYYGRYGTQTSRALQEAFCALEGSERAVVLSSGLGAVSTALMAFLGPGDHLLMVDTTYAPTRACCGELLQRIGIETTFYDPMVGAEIVRLIRPNTKVVFLESPGSDTFEVQDVAAIVAAARARNCVTMLDNTWATPLFFKPPAHGIDVSIYSATKYVCGHSDVMMGIVTSSRDLHRKIATMGHSMLGHSVSGDDCYLALRGLRTMHARLAQHQETGLVLARWLEKRPEVERVLHPALPTSPGHEFWKRDFTGASGLFSIVLKPAPVERLAAMLDGMALFKMGFSWGGYESLAVVANPRAARSATPWTHAGPVIRLHAGLEDPADLIADLEAGLARLKAI